MLANCNFLLDNGLIKFPFYQLIVGTEYNATTSGHIVPAKERKNQDTIPKHSQPLSVVITMSRTETVVPSLDEAPWAWSCARTGFSWLLGKAVLSCRLPSKKRRKLYKLGQTAKFCSYLRVRYSKHQTCIKII